MYYLNRVYNLIDDGICDFALLLFTLLSDIFKIKYYISYAQLYLRDQFFFNIDTLFSLSFT